MAGSVAGYRGLFLVTWNASLQLKCFRHRAANWAGQASRESLLGPGDNNYARSAWQAPCVGGKFPLNYTSHHRLTQHMCQRLGFDHKTFWVPGVSGIRGLLRSESTDILSDMSNLFGQVIPCWSQEYSWPFVCTQRAMTACREHWNTSSFQGVETHLRRLIKPEVTTVTQCPDEY